MSTEPAVDVACGDWTTRFTGTQKLSKFWFADMTPGQEQLHVGPRNLFQHYSFLFFFWLLWVFIAVCGLSL